MADNTQKVYADWIAVNDLEAFITVRISWSIPPPQAFRIFRNEILLTICRSSPGNDIACITVLSPGHPGDQQRNLHAGVTTKHRNILPNVQELLIRLRTPKAQLFTHENAVNIIPFRRVWDAGTEGRPRKPHPIYMSEHITGAEDLLIYGQKFLASLRSNQHG